MSTLWAYGQRPTHAPLRLRLAPAAGGNVEGVEEGTVDSDTIELMALHSPTWKGIFMSV